MPLCGRALLVGLPRVPGLLALNRSRQGLGFNILNTELIHFRNCSGTVFESTKITNKLLDANTLYQLDKYSKYSPAPISIQHLLDHGRESDAKGSFLFLKREIPTRFTQKM
jgi:hypothetical protein